MARYSSVIEKFGQQIPFSNIIKAEEVHINHLKPLLTKYNVKIPTDIKESLEMAVKGETANTAMYDRFLKQDIPDDVKAVFTELRNASQNHLKAFERALKAY